MRVDHLVMGAATLDAAVRWCESTLGCTPAPGGQHALMGTHNRLVSLGPRCYLEFIAIDPAAPTPTAHRRWFGLDDPATKARLARGPALLHWVAACDDIDAARAACRTLGADPGEPTAAARGDFRWQITIRPDGIPQGGGAIPAFIQWEGPHPADRLPPSPWRLLQLQPGLPTGLTATLIADGPPPRTLTLP